MQANKLASLQADKRRCLMEPKLTRRSFLGFAVLGALLSLALKKLKPKVQEKKAMFWRRSHEA